MLPDKKDKSLELDRLVFFSDAVIAIAITLLALDLKVQHASAHFTLIDLANAWHKFAAFLLSFIIIALFWINHHRFFAHIKAIDLKIVAYNIGWLLFIVLLPFTTSLIGEDFFNKAAMFVYSINILLVTYFQNAIWDRASGTKGLTRDSLTKVIRQENQVMCKLAIGNAAIAMVVVFLSPFVAFILLLARTFMLQLSAQRWVAKAITPKAANQTVVGNASGQPH
jgi:uncharacterized membrane protein